MTDAFVAQIDFQPVVEEPEQILSIYVGLTLGEDRFKINVQPVF